MTLCRRAGILPDEVTQVSMANQTGKPSSQAPANVSRREALLTRVAFAVFAFFAVYGVVLLFAPTNFLTDLYAVLLLVTLAVGVVTGLVAIVSS